MAKEPCLPPVLNPCLRIHQSFYRSLGWGCRTEGTCTYLGLHVSKYWGSVTMSTNTGTPAPPFVEAKSHIYEHTGPLPSADPMAPTIFQEGSKHLPHHTCCCLERVQHFPAEHLSESRKLYPQPVCNYYIFSTIEKSSSLGLR